VRSKGVVRHIGGGGGDPKCTALKPHRQCPFVLLVKINLEALRGIVESRRWSEKKWTVFGYTAEGRGRAFWVELRVLREEERERERGRAALF